jgi:DUF917 family protein
MQNEHLWQGRAGRMTTLSPALILLTEEQTLYTTPTPSWPMIKGSRTLITVPMPPSS